MQAVGEVPSIQLLLRAGASITAVDREGSTALAHAAAAGQVPSAPPPARVATPRYRDPSFSRPTPLTHQPPRLSFSFASVCRCSPGRRRLHAAQRARRGAHGGPARQAGAGPAAARRGARPRAADQDVPDGKRAHRRGRSPGECAPFRLTLRCMCRLDGTLPTRAHSSSLALVDAPPGNDASDGGRRPRAPRRYRGATQGQRRPVQGQQRRQDAARMPPPCLGARPLFPPRRSDQINACSDSSPPPP